MNDQAGIMDHTEGVIYSPGFPRELLAPPGIFALTQTLQIFLRGTERAALFKIQKYSANVVRVMKTKLCTKIERDSSVVLAD